MGRQAKQAGGAVGALVSAPALGCSGSGLFWFWVVPALGCSNSGVFQRRTPETGLGLFIPPPSPTFGENEVETEGGLQRPHPLMSGLNARLLCCDLIIWDRRQSWILSWSLRVGGSIP